MADITNELILEHLKRIQGALTVLQDGQTDLKQRMSAIERGIGGLKHDSASIYEDHARQQSVIDRLSERVDRIERRLELNG